MRPGARGVLAAADQIHARIADAEKLRAALEDIKQLHAEAGAIPCDRCCATTQIIAKAGI